MQRRTYLKAMSTGSLAAMAGCTGGEENGNGDSTTNGGSTSDDSEFNNIELSVADMWPEDFFQRQLGIVPWTEEVTEQTDGQVTFEMYPSGQLGDGSDMLDLLKAGSTDIAAVGPSYVSDQLPLSTVSTLPGTYDSAQEGGNAMYELANGILYEEELQRHNVRPILAGNTPPYQLVTNSEVHSTSDMEGLNIRSGGGGHSNTIEALGATPVEVGSSDVVSAMENGVVDSLLFPIITIPSFDAQTYFDYSTTNTNLAGWSVLWLIREEAFNSLNSATQEVFDTASEQILPEYGAGIEEANESARDEVSSDMNFYETDAVGEFGESFESVYQDWASDMNDRGLPGTEVLEAWTDQFE